MGDFDLWLREMFRRDGGELLVGPIAYPQGMDREDVEALIEHLREITDRLPTLDHRLSGLTTCEECEGRGVFLDDEGVDDVDCRACQGSGLAVRQGFEF